MKRERAFVESRRNRIVEMLQGNPEVRVDELSQILGVSLITVRRDLQYLEEQNLLVRTYGGAVSTMAPQYMKDEVQLYRGLIARYAAVFVAENDTIFINTSSNALQILEHMQCGNVTVITNNGKAIGRDYPSGVNVVLTGGELRHPKDAMVGDFTLRNLQNVYAKKAFVGCSGISAEAGMTTEIFNEVSINEMMIDHANQDVFVLADHTKIGRNSSFTSCPIEKIQYLITDEKAPQDALNAIREKGVRVYQVHKTDFKPEQ
ncbi:DeoR/GlpR family DNA-binding transcription regulator [Clostridium porci]|uniref:DeoR/GlpR transcriptional regulator n=1 Tax=Clostridium porci TaxID=2605778 RepID=A0A7X2NLV0_9CLOT|nr:DeoR/GlpR family DNA-binding transcription regulator [Clostridium porci]MSS37229.1 DeoR/GlpR transcriptional regulator [Clostridium porci]